MRSGIILMTAIFLSALFSLVISKGNNEKSFSTSIADMEQLLKLEMHMVESVEKYTAQLQSKVNSLKNLVHVLKEENEKSANEREEYRFNPLNGYSLIRRLYNDWTQIKFLMTQPVWEEHLAGIFRFKLDMPTATDLAYALEAINRLQIVYDLKVEDLVQGIINGQQYNVKLKSIDSYFMGKYLFNEEYYYSAGSWLNSSIINYEDESDYNKIVNFGKEKSLELYAETLVMQNRPQEALCFISQAVDIKLLDVHLLRRRKEIAELAIKDDSKPLEHTTLNITDYERGCRGYFANKTSRMYCLYNTTTTPFLRLAPIKMEIINFEPYMVLLHDVITDREIQHFTKLARPNLQRSVVYNYDENRPQAADYRTSKFFWFEDDFDDITIRINKRIEDMTGFDIVDAEILQIVNYGLGGHYENHYDFFNFSEDDKLRSGIRGDRISTVLFYLSDVEQGGATVFPEIKTAVLPRKGSALLWYNLNNKAEVDQLTLHAACPVIVGSKWILSKWIRANSQVFRKPCYKH